jgi:hypothetical protein
MLARFFPPKEIKAKNMQDISPSELMSLTLTNFHSEYPTCEVETMFRVSRALLAELDVNDKDFNRKYDSIIFGSIVVARALEHATQREFAYAKYEKSLREMIDICQTNNPFKWSQSRIEDDPDYRAFIISAGEHVLSGTLPFKESYLDYLEFSKKYVPLKQRLGVYIHEYADAYNKEQEQIIQNENASSWLSCQIL